MKTRVLKEHFSNTILPAVLNSYSVIFFFNNRFFSLVLLLVTFFNPVAGLSGLAAATATVLIADRMGFDKALLRQGIYSFNALLAGIGMGTMYEPGIVFSALLMLVSVISLLISVTLGGFFSRSGLPILSIPFVISIWIIMVSSAHMTNLGLTQRNVFWMNEMYSVGGKPLLDIFQVIDNLPLNRMLVIYLRSMSSIIFQDNLLAGIIIATAILITSRITFLLSILGFTAAYLFAFFIGSDMASFSFYNVGVNYILLAIAIGGFFLIPSAYSFLWAVIMIPVISMLILFLRMLTGTAGLPLFSLPFSIATIVFVYFLKLRIEPGALKCTLIQNYLPETNLYTYINNSDRLRGFMYSPVFLPFWGEWTVYQGYNGQYTHKGEWKNALDFVIKDESGKLFSGTPYKNENYYCHDKPVLAPADGYITELVDNVLDNEPGKVNTEKNWGNTVVIKHSETLYSQLSHLKQGSIRRKKGEYVRKGEVLASCGNSGRSPESHLHFQLQSSPAVGSKTTEYPFAYYLRRVNGTNTLCSWSVPSLDDIVSNVTPDTMMVSAFDLQPGMNLEFLYSVNGTDKGLATWEILTDVYNNKYVYCSESKSYAYFVNDGIMFYFTAFYGNQNSLLFSFYQTFYKIFLGHYPEIEISDSYPLNIIKSSSAALWLHDFVAPFYRFIEIKYNNRTAWSDAAIKPDNLKMDVTIDSKLFGKSKQSGKGSILVEKGMIKEFALEFAGKNIWAKNSNI